jgi:hypothetical protein
MKTGEYKKIGQAIPHSIAHVHKRTIDSKGQHITIRMQGEHTHFSCNMHTQFDD